MSEHQSENTSNLSLMISSTSKNSNTPRQSRRLKSRYKRSEDINNDDVPIQAPPISNTRSESKEKEDCDFALSSTNVGGKEEEVSLQPDAFLNTNPRGSEEVNKRPKRKDKRSMTVPADPKTVKRPRRQVRRELNLEEENQDMTEVEEVVEESERLDTNLLFSSEPPTTTLLGSIPSFSSHSQSTREPHGDNHLPALPSSSEQGSISTQSPFKSSISQPLHLPNCSQCQESIAAQSFQTSTQQQQIINFPIYTIAPSPFYPDQATVDIETSGGNSAGQTSQYFQDNSIARNYSQSTIVPPYNSSASRQLVHHYDYLYQTSFNPSFPWAVPFTTAPQLDFPPLPKPYSEFPCCSIITEQANMAPIRQTARQQAMQEIAISRERSNEGKALNSESIGKKEVVQVSHMAARSNSRGRSRAETPTPAPKRPQVTPKKARDKINKRKGTPKRCAVACEPCRTYKRKCSGGMPCKLCIKRGRTDDCKYSEGPLSSSRQASQDEILKTEEDSEETSSNVKIKTRKSKTQEKDAKMKDLTPPRFHGKRTPPMSARFDKTFDDVDMIEESARKNRHLPEDAQDLDTSSDSDDDSNDSAFEFEETKGTVAHDTRPDLQQDFIGSTSLAPNRFPKSSSLTMSKMNSASEISTRPLMGHPLIPASAMLPRIQVQSGIQSRPRSLSRPPRRTCYDNDGDARYQQVSLSNGVYSTHPMSMPKSASAISFHQANNNYTHFEHHFAIPFLPQMTSSSIANLSSQSVLPYCDTPSTGLDTLVHAVDFDLQTSSSLSNKTSSTHLATRSM